MACRRKAMLWIVAVGCLSFPLLLLGCDDPIPLGPDLVDCNCECVTETPIGSPPTGNACGDPFACDPPCDDAQFCSTRGGCVFACEPDQPPIYDTRVNDVTLHVCVDASDPSLASRACSKRCDGYANGSLLQCANALLVALGLEDAGSETVPLDIADRITPSAAQSLQGIIIEECGTWLLDTLTSTCGAHSSGVAALTDLLLCIWSPLSFESKTFSAFRTCALTGDPPYTVQQVNGCPEFAMQSDTGTAVRGSPLASTESVNSVASTLTLSGSDVSPTTSHPFGTSSTGRIGPILILSSLDASLPDADLEVKGHDVSLHGGVFSLKEPVAAALSDDATFSIAPGKLQLIATGFIDDEINSVEAANTDTVTGRYDEAAGMFELAGRVDFQGVDANVQLSLAFEFVNRPPLTDAGPDQTVECSLPETREGTAYLSAAQSVDPDANDQITDYIWTVGNQLIGQGPDASEVAVNLGLGTRLATLATADTNGSTSRDTALITVVDTTAPVFDSVTVTPPCLWPQNHRMVLLRLGHEIQVRVHDGCDATPAVYIKSVESNQPALGGGSGNTRPDILNGTAATCLRSERNGTERTPRVYTITLGALDFSGHEATKVVQVTVPHQQAPGKCVPTADALSVPDDASACVANVE